jgi:hypothetical protein
MRDQVVRFCNTSRLRADRIIKAMYCGFDVHRNSKIMDEIVDISNVIEPVMVNGLPEHSAQLSKILRDLHKYFYPKDEADMNDNEYRQHALSMVEQDSKATFVTCDATIALNNTCIGGNFENNYHSNLYDTFNPLMVTVGHRNRFTLRMPVRIRNVVVRLTTDLLKVERIVANGDGVEVTCGGINPQFEAFANNLETMLYRMYDANTINKHVIVGGVVRFLYNKTRLDIASVRGKSCVYDQRGAAMNIEEDLRPGDDIRVLFTMTIHLQETRCVELVPHVFIKHCDAQADESDGESEIDSDVGSSTGFVDKSDINDEIVYEDC